ncbi:hypothetical protein M405DRAFT_869936, partial [Rhizopogon salebrosus TDB-379]
MPHIFATTPTQTRHIVLGVLCSNYARSIRWRGRHMREFEEMAKKGFVGWLPGSYPTHFTIHIEKHTSIHESLPTVTDRLNFYAILWATLSFTAQTLKLSSTLYLHYATHDARHSIPELLHIDVPSPSSPLQFGGPPLPPDARHSIPELLHVDVPSLGPPQSHYGAESHGNASSPLQFGSPPLPPDARHSIPELLHVDVPSLGPPQSHYGAESCGNASSPLQFGGPPLPPDAQHSIPELLH